ncbi:uncharacterized protein LOC119456839 isoform X8 [Dermacentor silvarum]|uniref:uncharacterized protein LOC119456839 isoform X7 n=1 Tax=Dermacentor silvarum TaxID=543639 RepID=UPI0021006DCA|nr:uncharacterized protein LOC119456839 isoform X7 [Dermacentor silvarum]XP_049525347.1 uncharacterized protein LOC119456839 isoform X8 [Dermacentor silvarum]
MAAANDLDNGTKPWTVEDFIRHVWVVIPDITSEVLKSVLEYVKSAGVTSEADIDKIEGSKLSAIVGPEKAIELLDYFRKEASNSKKPLYREDTSGTAGGSAPSAAVIPAAGGGSQMGQLFMMALEMQRQGNQQNWQMMKAMQETQKEFLGEVSTMMKETSSVVKDTLETMTKQTTEQANMHRETLTAMQNNTAAASRMNSETLLAVQQSMNETRKMNSETIKMVSQSMANMLEAQRKSAREIEEMIKESHQNGCVIS